MMKKLMIIPALLGCALFASSAFATTITCPSTKTFQALYQVYGAKNGGVGQAFNYQGVTVQPSGGATALIAKGVTFNAGLINNHLNVPGVGNNITDFSCGYIEKGNPGQGFVLNTIAAKNVTRVNPSSWKSQSIQGATGERYYKHDSNPLNVQAIVTE